MPINKILNQVKSGQNDTSQKAYFMIHSARYHQILTLIKKLNIPQNSKVLDIGCYPPHLFQSLGLLGYEPFGISSQHEKVKNKNVHITNIEIDKLPFSSLNFRFVLFSEVLEHITNHPQAIFNEINRVLNSKGYFLITTPNIIRSQNLVKLLLGQNIYYNINQLKENINHRHNREYTLSEVKNMVENSGLNIVKSGYFISYPPYRDRNKTDSLYLKFIKYLNYLFMITFPHRQDTLYILAQKD